MQADKAFRVVRGRWASTALALTMLLGSPLAAQDPINSPSSEPTMKYAIAIHGGAGPSSKQASDEANRNRIASMREALEIGKKILESGGSSLDAVEAVVVYLEDNPKFNAGKGAVFTSAGTHELDASIMDGRDKSCGAVAGVTTVKNPIRLARRVMTDTPHVLLAGAGAEKFAAEQGLDIVENGYFDTPETRARWEERRQRRLDKPQSRIQLEDVGSYLGTVGCVALDAQGNLAAATSTGGMTGKQFGRVGDSPIIGAGTYAENATCAVSCTGIGEQFIRHSVAADVAARLRYLQQPLDECVRVVLEQTLQPNDGGIIAVDRAGNLSMRYTTPGMARAAADSTGRFEVLWTDDEAK